MARGSILKQENKDGTITYYIKYRTPDGRQVKRAVGPRKKEAAAVLGEILHKIKAGKYVEVKDITFGELAKKWLALKKTQVRSGTFAAYRPAVNRLNGFAVKNDAKGEPLLLLKDCDVRSVSAEVCERFVASLSETGLKPATINKNINVLVGIMIKAVQWGYVVRNPAEFITRPRVPQKEMEMYTPDEINLILCEIEPRYRTMLLTICMTGMRLSEVTGLRWGDVDFASRRLFVRQTHHNGTFSVPKTEKSRRAILVPETLVEELKSHQLYQTVYLEKNEHDLVFTNTRGGPVNNKNFTRRTLRAALRCAGLREVERPCHALRHSYVSMLVDQGENIKFIQKQVGHSSARITWDVYSHLYPEAEKEAMKKLSSNFGTILVPRTKEEGQRSDATDPSTR